MRKFNVPGLRRRAVTSPVRTENTANGATFEGAAGFARDAKSELFLLAVTNMAGEDSFYEAAPDRDNRFRGVAAVAVSDPDWATRLIGWLRTGTNLRSASLGAAVEFVHARLAGGIAGGNRAVISSALTRADEPGELLACWLATYGRAVPKPVKRGVADAAVRLCTERSLLNWDSAERSVRFGDVLELTHPAPVTARQGALFRFAIDRWHDRRGPASAVLPMISARARLMAVPVAERRGVLDQPARLAEAGMTLGSAGWLAAGSVGRRGLAVGDPVDGLHGAAAKPAQLRRCRCFRRRCRAGRCSIGRPRAGGCVPAVADAVPVRLPSSAAAALVRQRWSGHCRQRWKTFRH